MKREFKVKSIPQCLKQYKSTEDENAVNYVTTSGRLYKELKEDGFSDYITEILLDEEHPGLLFPEQIVYLNDQIKGFIKTKPVGTRLNRLNAKKTEIIDILIALKIFERQLEEFSYNTGLSIYEMRAHNLLFTPDKRIVTVDIDNTQPVEYLGYESLPCFNNTIQLSRALYPIFMNGKFKSKTLQQIQSECLGEGYTKPSEFINEALDIMDHYIDVNTLEDYKNGLVLLRK